MLSATTGLLVLGCDESGRGLSPREAARAYPPEPQIPRVIALGNLRGAPPPSETEVRLAMFLFGAEPPPTLAIVNPTGLAADAESLLICDGVLGAVLRWSAATEGIREEQFDPPLATPFALDISPGGDRFICDRHGVHRVDARGNVRGSYGLDSEDFKPAGVLAVDDHVWITNLALHRIEVFDAASGEYIRSIGARGDGPAQFAMPRGLARTPENNVCVVDMLNNRVQVLDRDGKWLRDIGRAGDTIGTFGRPKDVAVGPDGTVFVTDAFSQRVHAFAPDGQVLLAFGEPGSSIGELTLPQGIAVSTLTPRAQRALPPDVSAEYYVFVAEQLQQPGIRVYAWLGGQPAASGASLRSGVAVGWKPHFPQSAAIDPHWNADRCTSCHEQKDGRLLPIAPEATDRLCLSCHDGTQAPADPHPIGRQATTELVTTPSDWPTVDGTIGCLTCHDIQRHCHPGARRPAVNYVLLRGYDPQRPLDYCMNCHHADVVGRFSPHRQRDATGRVREDACFFCHTQRPEIPADGRRRFVPYLRSESSDLCLNCHTGHWDLSPRGHVDRPVPPRIRRWMLTREADRASALGPQGQARPAAAGPRPPALLPLGDNMVTCYTCHNPHYDGLFPPGSELGALATNAEDRAARLRTDWIDLCAECHRR
jgi:sugar lactone lactonase YvrE